MTKKQGYITTKRVLGAVLASVALLAIVITIITLSAVKAGQRKASVVYSTENAPVELVDGLDDVERGQGEVKVDGEEIPTVESVESDGPVTDVNNTNCPEGEECGRGAYVPELDISSPQAFANQTLGVCLDVDGYFGAQCWDSMAAYFLNYTGHTLYTCGTGAAKGTIQDGCWQKNAGNEFTMIWDATQIQPGDIAVYSTGQWGHIGMAMGYYNNGYFTLLGQNQGGAACPGGGAAGNIINLSTRDFIGAFRPNIYIKPEPTPPSPEPAPEPTPEPTPEKEVKYTYVYGDCFSRVLVRLGLDEGDLWGPEGTVAYYTEQLIAQGMLDARGNVIVGREFALTPR